MLTQKFTTANWIAIHIGLAVFAYHLVHVRSIADAPLFKKSNLAFDFDVQRFTGLWCTSPFPTSENEDYYAVRHPLAVSVRLICIPMVHAGWDPTTAACIIAAALTAVSAAIIFKIALRLHMSRFLAFLFAMLWSVSATVMVPGALPEAYRLALVAVALQFLVAIRWVEGQEPATSQRVSIGVVNFGITITNVLLSALTELLCRLARQPLSNALRGTVVYGVWTGAVAVAVTVLSFLVWPPESIEAPTQVLKQVYWSAFSGGTAGDDGGQKQSVGEVTWTFVVTSLVAPSIGQYPTGLPGDPRLWDVRGQNYGLIGWIAVAGWIMLLTYGLVSAARDRKLWPLWAIAVLWVAFNIGLHSFWQYRGSVFLYGAHAHPALFLIAMAGARGATGRSSSFEATLTLIVLFVWLSNLPLYLQLPHLM